MFTVSIVFMAIAVLAIAALISKKRLKTLPKEKKPLLEKKTIALYVKGLGAGSMTGVAVAVMTKINNPVYITLIIIAGSLAGSGITLFVKKKLDRKEEERITEFSNKIYGAYTLAKKSYEELDSHGDIPFTQLELRRLDPILTAYETYEQQLRNGRVDNDAAEKLRQLAVEMEAINEIRMKRSRMGSGNKKARKNKDWTENNKTSPKDQMKETPPTPSYFKGCKDAESVKARYRNLCRTFHPDTGSGDADSFREMNEEYHRLLKKYAKET